jgi:hypothetical protein
MITLLGAKHQFCDGLTRRNFLKIGAFGSALSLAESLRLQAAAGGATRPKSAIMIQLGGGPSHIDMYDLKPDAPVEYRGEFKPIKTNIAGVQICELMPRQAQMWDKLVCIRSVVSREGHSDVETNTGYGAGVTPRHPSVGSVISKIRSGNLQGMPPFVSLRGMTQGQEPAYLGVAHRPFSPTGPGRDNLRLAEGITAERLKDRHSLLNSFDTLRRDLDGKGAMNGMDSITTRALDMVLSGSARKAFDLNEEPVTVRDRYKGVEQFLLARRLVEAGVGFVTLGGLGDWDTHERNFKTLRKLLPLVDAGIANLIQDLHDRGMQDDVVTVMWGEFGRGPKVGGENKNWADGRSHWPDAMSVLVAGGGLKMGQVVGATNARAEFPIDRRYYVPQVLATLYQAMGIDPATTFPDGSGRPMHLLDQRDPVVELL